jgi:transposase
MSWKESNSMDERQKMLGDYLSGFYNITELSTIYNVSRRTVYKWIARYESDPTNWQNDKNRAPYHHPNQTDSIIIDMLVDTKLNHKSWGPKKLVAFLSNKYPDLCFPASSTAGYWLKKHGLVLPRKRKRTVSPYSMPFLDCNKSNSVWSVDFKGNFKMQNAVIL